MSKDTKVNLSLSLLWAILGIVGIGAWNAAKVYEKVDSINSRMIRVEVLEKDVIRIKAHLGLTDAKSASSLNTAINR